VVLFHLGSSILPGGYAGVDIFFVISGYLITRIIDREAAVGSFRIIAFYERRMRRIFPALLVTMAATFAAGLVIFMPDELRDLGASIVATAAFSSNILFWMQTDYFAGPAEFKPLLHTWSLAVEEQFYIVVPALIVLIYKVRWRPQPVFVLLTLISFALSCLWVFVDSSGNYFLPHTRAWELLAGSLVALGVVPRIANDKLNEALALGALMLLVAPFFLLDETSAFPAWNALATCIGAALLIHTGEGRRTIAGTLLGVRPMVALGLVSYSLYLVHWPVIVFTKYSLLRDPTPLERAAILVVIVALAWASWRFVEQPFRDKRRVSRRTVFVFGLAASVGAAAFGFATFALDGLPQRLGTEARLVTRGDPQENPSANCFLREDWRQWQGADCFLTRGSGPVILLWGDSHALQFAPVLRAEASRFDSNVLLYASAACPPVFGIDIPTRPNCRANNDHALEIIRQFGVTRAVLSAYWQRILHSIGADPAMLLATVRRLEALGVDVRIIGDNPDFPFANPTYLGVRLARREDPDAPFYTGVRNDFGFNAHLARSVTPTHFYDPMTMLCRDRECLAYENGELLMVDNAHLSSYGAKKLLSQMESFFK